VIAAVLAYDAPSSLAFWAAWTTFAGLMSAAATYGVIRFAEAYGVMDIPNARSSHHRPTPRGGGIAIVLVGVAGVAALAVAGITPPIYGEWIVLGSLGIAAVSSLDDVFTISPKLRLAIQSVAALVAVMALGPIQRMVLGPIGTLDFGPEGWVLTMLWIVGMTNAFNFMDGIDGIAGVTAAIALAVIAIGLLFSGEVFAALVAAAIGAASAGFLVWNWQPARIFMGDVGSAFLGYTIAVLPLTANPEARAWLVPLTVFVMWPFLFDATYTIVRRVAKRENIFEAHRSHLYQRLVIVGWSHRVVTALYGGLSAIAGAAALAAFTIPEWSSNSMIVVAAGAMAFGAVALILLVHGAEAKALCRVSP